MRAEARKIGAGKIYPIYTNGGQGLFVVIADEAKTLAERFGKRVQRSFAETTFGGASVAYVIQPLPHNLPDDINALKEKDLSDYFRLLQVQMEIIKGSPSDCVVLPSHPLMSLCDACGIRYAEVKGSGENEPEDQYYCHSCHEKQEEDSLIKKGLEGELLQLSLGKKKQEKKDILNQGLWERILFYLQEVDYNFFPFGKQFLPERPSDFNVFRPITEAKEYIGLIYADANNMGAKVTQLKKLGVYEAFAEGVDRAIHQAMSQAIKKHLPIVQVSAGDKVSEDAAQDNQKGTLFPFDIFLVGGDDIVILTDAAKAMEVALTIGQEFRMIMKKIRAASPQLQEIADDQYSLSIGVVMAPIKYPFRLMLGLVENVLKEAKKYSAQARTKRNQQIETDFDDTRINFRIVNGGMQINAADPYHKKHIDTMAKKDQDKQQDFYATLRPYSPKQLDLLLHTIKKGQEMRLGRTKLHQMREAILQMNTTTSVNESIAVLRNWNEKQRQHIMDYHRHYGALYQKAVSDPNNPLAGLPRLLFPWFLDGDGQSTYRTALLDLVELYDFVAHERGDSNEQ